MTRTKPRQNCTFRWRPRLQKMRGSKPLQVYRDPASQPWNIPALPLGMKSSEGDMDFPAPRKGRLSGPQLQAQLSQLTGRSRLRRLNDTLLSKGDAARLHHQRAEKTWQQGLDKLWSVPLVRFLRGPTAGTRPRWVHYYSQLRNPGRLIPVLSQDAARNWMCVWPPAQQQQPEVTPGRRHLIANFHTAEMKYRICGTRAFTVAPSFGQRMGDHTQPLEQCSERQLSARSSADGSMKFKLLYVGEQP